MQLLGEGFTPPLPLPGCSLALFGYTGFRLSRLFRLWSLPRALPDGVWSAPDASRSPLAAFAAFLNGLGAIFYRVSAPQRGCGTSKIAKLIETSYKFWGFALLRLGCFCSSISDPLGRFLAPFWLPFGSQDGPNSLQDGPKMAPRRPKTPSSRLLELSSPLATIPRSPPELPRGFQEPPTTLQGSILTSPGSLWGSIFTPQGSQENSKNCSQAMLPVTANPAAIAVQKCWVGGCPR